MLSKSPSFAVKSVDDLSNEIQPRPQKRVITSHFKKIILSHCFRKERILGQLSTYSW